jgi:flavin-dependent dehydrogenase
VFPLSDGTANVGVDIPHRPRLRGCPPLRVLFDGFVEQLRRQRPGFAGARPESRPQGALLPEGMSGVRPSAPGLLLTGDAAGLVSPYSGEGIVYALESAELACQAIATGTSPTSIASGYTRALEEAYDFQFRGALAFMKGVRRRSLARLAAALGISHPRVLRAAVRVMAFLIEEDPSAPPSTISRLYLAAKRVLG